jgi:RNA polymerase sigma factor (sigma-70 family)
LTCHYIKADYTVKEFSDNEIIECLRNRQRNVADFLYQKYLPIIRHMVYQLGGTTEDARDIFQEGLRIMLENMEKKDFVLTCKFKTLFYSVCENQWKSILQKRKAAKNYQERRIEADDDTDITQLIDYKLNKAIFYSVFDTLDRVSQMILKLYWQELPPQEIADTLGYTYGYVRKKKCEGQAALVSKVKSHPDYKRIINSERLLKKIVF